MRIKIVLLCLFIIAILTLFWFIPFGGEQNDSLENSCDNISKQITSVKNIGIDLRTNSTEVDTDGNYTPSIDVKIKDNQPAVLLQFMENVKGEPRPIEVRGIQFSHISRKPWPLAAAFGSHGSQLKAKRGMYFPVFKLDDGMSLNYGILFENERYEIRWVLNISGKRSCKIATFTVPSGIKPGTLVKIPVVFKPLPNLGDRLKI